MLQKISKPNQIIAQMNLFRNQRLSQTNGIGLGFYVLITVFSLVLVSGECFGLTTPAISAVKVVKQANPPPNAAQVTPVQKLPPDNPPDSPSKKIKKPRWP